MHGPRSDTPYPCMTAAELFWWQAANVGVPGYHGQASSPCRDCDPTWRRVQVAAGRCNISPT